MQNMQNWRKGCVFGHIYNWLEHDGQIKKEHEKTPYLPTCKICA